MNKLTKLGLGTGYLCSVSGPSKSEAKKLFALALENGIDFVDTSPRYGQGDAEKLVGSFMKKAEFDVCTKVGYLPRDKDWLIRLMKPMVRFLKNRKKKNQSVPSTPSSTVSNPSGATSPPQDFSQSYLESSVIRSLGILNNSSKLLCLLHDPPCDSEEEVQRISEHMALLKLNGYIHQWGIGTGNLKALKLYAELSEPDIIQTSFLSSEREEKLAFFKALPAQTTVIVNSIFSELKTDEERESAIEYVVKSGVVDYLLLGTTNRAHLEKNISTYRRIIQE